MQKCAKVGSIFVICLLMSGCFMTHLGSESAIGVRGNIIFPDNIEAPSSCQLELFRSEGNRKVREKTIELKFDSSFVISGGRHEYYMVVRCPGGWTYRTQIFKLGSIEYHQNPLDLGDIHLVRSTNK